LSGQLKIASLNIGYNNKAVITGINIESKTNQLIAVIGRNGKGKSTLLKTLSGVLPPITGSFYFNTIDILKLTDKERSKILSIVSSKQLNIGNVTVKDFIAFGRFPYTNWLGINKDHDNSFIQKAIDLCQLNSLVNRIYDELSDGEKQKVNIARAIAQNTPIIILDEPTAHLDLINKIEVLKLLQSLVTNEDKTIIISTHQIEYALQICSELWLVNNNIEAFQTKDVIANDKLKELFDENLIQFDKASLTFKLI
jgi:iron complex transport system ATP-binding protein